MRCESGLLLILRQFACVLGEFRSVCYSTFVVGGFRTLVVIIVAFRKDVFTSSMELLFELEKIRCYQLLHALCRETGELGM
jgi:hypothetical protein